MYRIAIVMAAVLLGTRAYAYNNDSNRCATESENARKACTTNDLYSGFTPDQGPQARTVSQASDQLNGQVAGTGAVLANQCRNRAENSRKMAELSDKKADACQAALSQCSDVCQREKQIYEHERDMDAALLMSERANRKTGFVNERASSLQTCQGYQQNVQQARQQAQNFRDNEKQNSKCVADRSTGADSERGDARDPGALSHAGPPSNGDSSGGDRTANVARPSSATFDDSSGGGGRGPASRAPADRTADSVAEEGKDVGAAESLESGQAIFIKDNGEVHQLGRGAGVPGTIGKTASLGNSGMGGGGSGAIAGEIASGGGRGPAEEAPVSPRDVSGMSIPTTDGMTGPNGPSIFEKISRRYRAHAGNLVSD